MTTPISTPKKMRSKKERERTIQNGRANSVSVSVYSLKYSSEPIEEFAKFWKEYQHLALSADTESFARMAYFKGRMAGLDYALAILKK